MKLEVGGELNSFLEYVKSDNELRIEVRTKGLTQIGRAHV